MQAQRRRHASQPRLDPARSPAAWSAPDSRPEPLLDRLSAPAAGRPALPRHRSGHRPDRAAGDPLVRRSAMSSASCSPGGTPSGSSPTRACGRTASRRCSPRTSTTSSSGRRSASCSAAASATSCSTISPAIIANPLDIFAVWQGGMSFHGGFAGITLAMILFARSRGIRIWSLFDVSRPACRSASASSASPTSSIPSSGAGRPTCPGPSSSRMAARSRAIRASSTRRCSKGSCCSSCCALLTHSLPAS